MPSTYTPLATVTVGTAGTTFLVMDSIPSTYTDLILVINGSAAAVAQLGMRFNNVSTSTYSATVMGGSGTAAESGRNANVSFLALDYYYSLTTTSGAGTVICNIMNYSNTTTNKTTLVRTNNAGQGVSATVGLFRSTNAVSRIDVISTDATNIAVGSTFTLYGVKSA